MNERTKGNLSVRASEFAAYCEEARSRAYASYEMSYDASKTDEEGKKRLAERLDEKEGDLLEHREECIRASGLIILGKCDKDLEDMDSNASKLVVQENSCNKTTSLSLPTSLVALDIQSGSLTRCGSVQWTNLNQLRSITIGPNCFSSSEAVSSSKSFSLSSCPALQVLVIGDGSFALFGVLFLSDLSMLKEITLGEGAFCSFESATIESRL